MKALTITQPRATLVAIGVKRIETRSWSTTYRGPLAIHAAKGYTPEVVDLFFQEPFKSTLNGAGYKLFSSLPRGAIIATCDLVSVRAIPPSLEKFTGWEWVGPYGDVYKFPLDDTEKFFGNYAPGRYAWLLHNIQPVPVPVPAKGALSLWKFDLPKQLDLPAATP